MGTITSGVGLFSGLDYTSLVDQLMTIEARPRDLLVQRMSNLDAQRTAFLDVSARISALLARVSALSSASFFNAATATSSDPTSATVTASAGAQPGSYTFTVRSLATAHQLLSRGYAGADAAVEPGTFTIESAQAAVDRQTELAELNGYTGVQRGSFKLIDGAGAEAVIDIRDAQSVGDVIDRINAAGIGVHAELRDEGLVLTDTTDGTLGLRVREVNDGHVAADLGFGTGNTYNSGGELTGSAILYLAGSTPLSALNDGIGIRRSVAGTDFTIQSSDSAVKVNVELSEIIKPATRLERLNHGRGVALGTIHLTSKNGVGKDIDLSGAKTINDVKEAIESQFTGVSVVMAGGRLVITDSTDGTADDLSITDVTGHAARDLGILGSTDSTKIDGRQILHVDTVADVIAAINYGDGNQYGEDGTPVIQAALDPDSQRLVITDHGGGSATTVLATTEGSTSKALADLGFAVGEYDASAGLTGQRILGGIDTVLLKTLNGGQGFTGGTIHVEANGAATDIDLNGAETLRDVIEQINAAAAQSNLGIEAGYDRTGTRLLITNTVDDTALIAVSDVTGDFAQSVGLDGSAAYLRSDNLQRQYISEATTLDSLNAGSGVNLGSFKITDSAGQTSTVDLTADGAETLQDVIDAINALSIGVEARINDTGDGLAVVDTAGGAGTLTIVEDGGTTAHDLNLLGPAEEGRVDGSFEFKIDATGGVSLSDVVDRVNATSLATASLLNDGSTTAPYRLSVTSKMTGHAGELILDGGDTDFDFTTLAPAQDASVVLGGSAEGGMLITSSSNTLTDIANGLTINLTSVSDKPVTVTVGRDVDSMVEGMQGLVEAYNSLVDRIGQLDSYNADTETAGLLLGDGTLQTIESRLFRMFTATVAGATGSLKRLSQVGVTFSDGHLSLDEEKFRAVYEKDPAEVNRFFTAAETGLAPQLKESLEDMTETGGLLKRQDEALQSQKEILNNRVDQLNALLERKRAAMLRSFQMMEQAIGQLQSQQQALNSFASQMSSNWGT